MKKTGKKIGKALGRTLGFLGGGVFSLIMVFSISTLLRLMNWNVDKIGIMYAAAIISLPFVGAKFYDKFTHFIAPLFNLFANSGDGGTEMTGPSLCDKWSDFFMQAFYLLSILLLFISAFFSASKLLFISMGMFVPYAVYVITKKRPNQTSEHTSQPPSEVSER